MKEETLFLTKSYDVRWCPSVVHGAALYCLGYGLHYLLVRAVQLHTTVSWLHGLFSSLSKPLCIVCVCVCVCVCVLSLIYI